MAKTELTLTGEEKDLSIEDHECPSKGLEKYQQVKAAGEPNEQRNVQ